MEIVGISMSKPIPIEEIDKEFAEQILDVVHKRTPAIVSNTRVFETINGKLKEVFLDKIGRNDPCMCGSNKKFKKCCEGKL